VKEPALVNFKRPHSLFARHVTFLLLCFNVSTLAGQIPASIDAKRETVAEELRVAMLQEAENQAPQDDAIKSDESDVDLLKQIEVVIAQQKNATATIQDIQSKQVELETVLGRLADNRLDEGPPYSILMLDQLRDAIAADKTKRESLESSLLAARETLERARLKVEQRKKSLRQIKESGVAETDDQTKTAQLELRLAEEMLVLRRQELSIIEANEIVRALSIKIDETKLAIVKSGVVFSKETLIEKTAELDARENELKRRQQINQSELQYAEQRWFTARQEMDSTPNPPADVVQRVEALKVAQQTIQLEQSVLNQRLQRLPMIRTAWQRRYAVVAGQAKRDERNAWLDETMQQAEQLIRERRSAELKLDETRAALATVTGRVDNLETEDAGLRRWLKATSASLNKQVELYNSSMLGIDSATRALDRLKVEIEGEPSRTLDEWISDSWAAMKRFWNYELTSIDDTSLTVGKVVSILMFFVFGYFAAAWLSRLLGFRLPKLGVDEAGAHAIESLSFYVLLILFSLGALRYANVPLTVFTFLGGAIAIGVGFGSQNILNNFISGLILLAERPIKAGDLIKVGDTYGNVKSIGARSTTIRTGENQDIIVPNSKFLENEVTNLTRRDDRLRTFITVGVAYGSPLEEVVRLLELSAAESAGVDERPKPFVWFTDFGDNSLAFQVHFWVHARSVSAMKKVETEVRMNIDRHFREHQIVIAFPQRDLHLQSDAPLEFRLVGDDGKKPAA
jgi:small-conductance mechanosensitive channel